MNIDSTWAQKMVEAQQSIGRLSDMQVIARAKHIGKHKVLVRGI